MPFPPKSDSDTEQKHLAMVRATQRRLHPLFIFALLFSLLFVLHAPLLRLPYFWDEAGYYIPAARDLLLTHSLVPHSTASNAHPPLVPAWLALWWRFSGYTPAVTRTAMLLAAAFALLGVFRLANHVANLPVAVAATAATGLDPVFFSQSSMAHLDLAAAALSLWGIAFLLEHRRAWAVAVFCLAVLAKETAVIVPLALGAWELLWWIRRSQEPMLAPPAAGLRNCFTLIFAPAILLAAWYGFHYQRTGYVFGNPEFFRYNVAATLNPVRVLLALVKRIWHLAGYMNLFLLTAATAMAMTFPAQTDAATARPRPRIALNLQALFAVVIVAQVALFSVVGGAPLARYLLTSLPLVIIICVSTIWRRMREWPVVIGIVCAGFVLALFVNPPYPFALEDNLAYRDYVLLHKRAADFIVAHHPRKRVLTSWPATDELTRPYLGYSRAAIPVMAIDDFAAAELMAAARGNSQYDLALLFSTKYDPPHNLLNRIAWWERWQVRFFGYHRDVPPEVAAGILGGRLIYRDSRNGQWIAVVQMERVENAQLPSRGSFAATAFLARGRARADRPCRRVLSPAEAGPQARLAGVDQAERREVSQATQYPTGDRRRTPSRCNESAGSAP
jgi:hypothetical protein